MTSWASRRERTRVQQIKARGRRGERDLRQARQGRRPEGGLMASTRSDHGTSGSLPLAGVRVLSCEQFIAGPYGSMVLAVLRCRCHPRGTPAGGRGHARIRASGRRTSAGARPMECWPTTSTSAAWVSTSSRTPGQRPLQAASCATWTWCGRTCVPGTLDKLGLGYEDLKKINPGHRLRLDQRIRPEVGFDRAPTRRLPAFDIMAQAMGGLMLRPWQGGGCPCLQWLRARVTSFLPCTGRAGLRDGACMAATRTGVGQHVDISMYDATVFAAVADHGSACDVARDREARKDGQHCAVRRLRGDSDGHFIVACRHGGDLAQLLCEVLNTARPASGSDAAVRSRPCKSAPTTSSVT